MLNCYNYYEDVIKRTSGRELYRVYVISNNRVITYYAIFRLHSEVQSVWWEHVRLKKNLGTVGG